MNSKIEKIILAVLVCILIYTIYKIFFESDEPEIIVPPPVTPPPQEIVPPPPVEVVDCTQFINKDKCDCGTPENSKNLWCRIPDELFLERNCNRKCQEKSGASRCALHFRSPKGQRLYYCAKMK